MKLTQQQINTISSSISISDIKAYINAHADKYEEFLRQRKMKAES